MLLENRSGQPKEVSLLPISNAAIRITYDQVKADPKQTFLEDLNEIRTKQPVIKSVMEKNPYNDPALNTHFYKFGIARSFRFFRNHANLAGYDLPEIPIDCFLVLEDSLEEDNRLKKFNQYHLSSVNKIGIELREDQYDLWMALQEMSTNQKEYKSYMKGVLTVFFLFKTLQENDYFERLLDYKG
ncbi:MAG: hypothetical protein Q8P65_00395 [bacterium]|nr:hypothetical protein [bacterium]